MEKDTIIAILSVALLAQTLRAHLLENHAKFWKKTYQTILTVYSQIVSDTRHDLMKKAYKDYWHGYRLGIKHGIMFEDFAQKAKEKYNETDN